MTMRRYTSSDGLGHKRTSRIGFYFLLRTLKVLVFALILSSAINSANGVCVWQRGGGFRLACGFRQSGLFRVRALGGLKGWAGAGFTIGDEDGFKDSLTNAEQKKQQLLKQQQQHQHRGAYGQQHQQQQQPQRGLFGILPQKTQQSSIFNNPLFGSHSNVNVQQAAATPEDLALQALKNMPLDQLELLQKQQQAAENQRLSQQPEQSRPVRVAIPVPVQGGQPGIVSAQLPILSQNPPAGMSQTISAQQQLELSRVGLQKRSSLWHWPLSLFQKRQPQAQQQQPGVPLGYAPQIRGVKRRGPFSRPPNNRGPPQYAMSTVDKSPNFPSPPPQRQGLPFYKDTMDDTDPLIADETKTKNGQPYGVKLLEGSENYGSKFVLEKASSPLGIGDEDPAVTAGYDTNIFPDIYFTTTTPKNKLVPLPEEEDEALPPPTTTMKKRLKKVRVIKHRNGEDRRKHRKRKKLTTTPDPLEDASEETTATSTKTSKSTITSTTPKLQPPPTAPSSESASTTGSYEPDVSESTHRAVAISPGLMTEEERQNALKMLYNLGITTAKTTTTSTTQRTKALPKSDVVVKLINPLINNGYDPRFPPDHPVNRVKLESLTTTTTTQKPFYSHNNFYNPTTHFSKTISPLFPKPGAHNGYVKLDSTETVSQINKTRSYNNHFYSHFNRTLTPFDLKVDDAYLYNAATTNNYPKKLLPGLLNSNYWTPADPYNPDIFSTTVASTLKVDSTSPYFNLVQPAYTNLDAKPVPPQYNSAPSGYYGIESKTVKSISKDIPAGIYRPLDSRQESSNGIYKNLDSTQESSEAPSYTKFKYSAESGSGEVGPVKAWSHYKPSKPGAGENKLVEFKPIPIEPSTISSPSNYWTEKPVVAATTPQPTAVPWWKTTSTTPRPTTTTTRTTTTTQPPTTTVPWWKTSTPAPIPPSEPTTKIPWWRTSTRASTQKYWQPSSTSTTKEPETTKRHRYHRKRYKFKTYPTSTTPAPTTRMPAYDDIETEAYVEDDNYVQQPPSNPSIQEDSYEPEVPQFKYASRGPEPPMPLPEPSAPSYFNAPTSGSQDHEFANEDEQEREAEEVQPSMREREPDMAEPDEPSEIPPTMLPELPLTPETAYDREPTGNSDYRNSEEPRFKVISEHDLSENSQGFVSLPGAGINKLLSQVASLTENKKSVGLSNNIYFNRAGGPHQDELLKLSFVPSGEPLDLELRKPSGEAAATAGGDEAEENEETANDTPSTYRPHVHQNTMHHHQNDDQSVKPEENEPEYDVMPPILPENRYPNTRPEDFTSPINLQPVNGGAEEEYNDGADDDEPEVDESRNKPLAVASSEKSIPMPSSVFIPPSMGEMPQERYPYAETAERVDLPDQDLNPPLLPAQAEELMKPVDGPKLAPLPTQEFEPPGPSSFQRYGPFQTEQDAPASMMMPPSPTPNGFKGYMVSHKPTGNIGTGTPVSPSQNPGVSGIFKPIKQMLNRAPGFVSNGFHGATQYFSPVSMRNSSFFGAPTPQSPSGQPQAPYLVHHFPSAPQESPSNAVPIAVPVGHPPPPGAKLIPGPPPGLMKMPPMPPTRPAQQPSHNPPQSQGWPSPAPGKQNSYRPRPSPPARGPPTSLNYGEPQGSYPRPPPPPPRFHQGPPPQFIRFPAGRPPNNHHSFPQHPPTLAPTASPKSDKPLSEKETVLKALETLSKVKSEVIQSIVHEKLGVKKAPATKMTTTTTTTTTPIPPQLQHVASKLAPFLAGQKQMATDSNQIFSISTDAISSLFTKDEDKKNELKTLTQSSPDLEAQINAALRKKHQQLQQIHMQHELLKQIKLNHQKPNPPTTPEPPQQSNHEILRTLSQIAHRLKSPDALNPNRTYSPAQIETMRKLLALNKLEDALKAQYQPTAPSGFELNDWKPKVNSVEIPSNVLAHKSDQLQPISSDHAKVNTQAALLALQALAMKKAHSLHPSPEVSTPQQAKPKENRYIQGAPSNGMQAVDLSAILASPSPILLKFPEPSLSNKWMPRNRLIDVKNAPKSFYPGETILRFDTDDNLYTDFSCEDQKYFPGLYADPTLSCKVFHLCAKSETGYVRKTFRCPSETVFDQEVLRCNWNLYVDCSTAESKYNFNKYLSQSFQFLRILGEFSASYKPRNATTPLS